MNYGTKAERNREICRRYHDGETLRGIAEVFGISMSSVYQVVIKYAPLSIEQTERRRAERCRKYLLTPESRAKSIEGIRRCMAEGRWRAGRKAIFANDPAKRLDYITLQRKMGAAYARNAMGLAA